MALRLPPRSAYPSGDEGSEQRWADYKLIEAGQPPRYARPVSESLRRRTPITEEAPAVPDVGDIEVTPGELYKLQTDDPEAYRALDRAFAEAVFAHHDQRRGQSPFNRA